MKKFIIVFLIITALGLSSYISYYFYKQAAPQLYIDEDGIKYAAKVDSSNFYLYNGESFEKMFIKGVNLGVGKPGYFPGEFGITKEDYLRWFKRIKEMNSNTIRVYIIQNTDFYEALYLFNKNNPDPLYVMHGVWLNDDMWDCDNVFADNGVVIDNFIRDAFDTIDVIHGNKVIGDSVYNKDISAYVIGWILGVEWDPDFVYISNTEFPEKTSYNGEYMFTADGAVPFETFWCKVADEVVRYETGKYNMQRPLSITNWSSSDPLEHPNEPLFKENLVSLTMEHIKAKDGFKTGVFASYHSYPYYPEYMNYEPKYIDRDPKNINTFKAYLRELRAHHTMPVLVAEVGLPTSRGITHESRFSGFNQGRVTEEEQGHMLVSMIDDIIEEDYMGVLIFVWQDEWFKRTWNTMDYNIPDRRAYWADYQTCEQYFGLMAFDPGEKASVCYVDGNFDDWAEARIIHEGDGFKIYFQNDAKFMYFMIDGNHGSFDFENDALLLPIDTIPDQGNAGWKNYTFKRQADFVININGKENSRLLIDPYYQTFYFSNPTAVIKDESGSGGGGIESRRKKHTNVFDRIYLALCRELLLPLTKEIIPFSYVEAGHLRYGNANPYSPDYDSLADFIYNDGRIELRIPWALLNIADPSSKQIISDWHNTPYEFIEIKEFYIGIIKENSFIEEEVLMSRFTWKKWDMPDYHERLKSSYYIIKEKFNRI